MNVLIINPPWPGKGFGTRSQNRIIKHRGDKFLQYPVFLAYSAAQIKEAGHHVTFIDSVIQDYDIEETLKKVREAEPDLVFMETTTPSIEADYISLKALKDATGAMIAVGGPHATYFHREVLKDCEAVDIVIRHEFDTKISNVVSKLNNLSAVKGITYRDNGRIVDNGDGEVATDLDKVPFPDREVVPWQWYLEAWYSRQPYMLVMTSRGCPYHCAFCLWPQSMYGHSQRFRTLDNVFSELHMLVDRYGLREINVDDGNFTTRKNRVIEFCQRMRDEKLKILWTCNARFDNVDDEMLTEMKASGCKMMRMGIESGSQEVLDRIKKGLKLDRVEEGVRQVKRHGIQVQCGFMFGFPYDSRESVEQTLQFAKKVSPDQVQFSIAMAYPGTQLYDYAKDNDLLLVKSFKEFDMTCGPVVKTMDMEREELTHILSRAYREYYFRPSYILQTMKHMRDVYETKRVLRSMGTVVKNILLHK
jgi:radical SAM superfamily enzyme YgiQ (UPF0313 family)